MNAKRTKEQRRKRTHVETQKKVKKKDSKRNREEEEEKKQEDFNKTRLSSPHPLYGMIIHRHIVVSSSGRVKRNRKH